MSKILEEKIRNLLGQRQIGGFFISNLANVQYISGYTNGDACLFITQDNKYVISDPRYKEELSYECPDYIFIDYRGSYGFSMAAAVAALAEKEGLASIGYEVNDMVVKDYLELERLSKAELVPLSGIVEELRSHKTPQEIEYLRAACEIASRAYDCIQKDIRVGVTEKELAANLSRYMVLLGADTQPYGNILISGARTSLLHGIPSSKAIEYGDFVLMDYGCQFNGYMSDMTRTLVVGKATPKQKEVYRLEQEMVYAMEASLRDGITGQVPYFAGADILKGTEYYQYHYTGVGHGIGLYVHEIPFNGPTSKDIIHENNVMTIEPGIYIPGWGGVRIEDQLLITKNGSENLISATRELIEL